MGTPNGVFFTAVILSLSIVLLTGCAEETTTGTHRPVASLQLHPCTMADLGEPPSSNDLECGTLSVAEDPSMPDGRRIDLHIVRQPAISAAPSRDPLFVLAGGPGQAATEIRGSVRPLTQRINQQRDIVYVDQRGTGNSNPLNCDMQNSHDYSLSEAEAIAALTRQLRDCFADYKATPAFYTTQYAVQDFDLVRQALGYEQINLWGISYGTRAALVYARQFPHAVRTLTLDGIAPLELSLPQHLAEDADAALALMFATCNNNPDCVNRYGDLQQRFRALIKSLDESPKTIDVVHPVTLETLSVKLSGYLLSNSIRAALYSRELSVLIPLIIDATEKGDYRPLAGVLALSENMAGEISEGMQYLVLCSEDFQRMSLNAGVAASLAVEAELPLLNLGSRKALAAICEAIPTAPVANTYFEMDTLPHPTLILSGQFDPVTPPRWGATALDYLPNAEHIVVPGTHHGSSFAGCMPRIVSDFIDAASTDNLTTDCVARIKPLPMFVSPAGPAMQTAPANDQDNQQKNEQSPEKAQEVKHD